MYYESKSPIDPTRTKRTVQYYDPENMWRYIGGGKRLPGTFGFSACSFLYLSHVYFNSSMVIVVNAYTAASSYAWCQCYNALLSLVNSLVFQELEADTARQRRILEKVALIEAKDREEAKDMRRRRQQDAHLAIEDAVAGRGEHTSNAPEVTEEALALDQSTNLGSRPQVESSQRPTQIRPSRFVTPASPRSRKSSTPFSIPSLNSSAVEPQSEIGGGDSSSPKPVKDPFAWKSSATETETWTPKARKRG